MRKLFRWLLPAWAERASAGDGTISSELTPPDIEHYYRHLIRDALQRMLLPESSFEVGIRPAGVGPGGLSAFAGYIRILRWDPLVTPVLLQNMPNIDRRVRGLVKASVLLEHTYYAGLWFQAESGAPGSPTALLGVPVELVRQARGGRPN